MVVQIIVSLVTTTDPPSSKALIVIAVVDSSRISHNTTECSRFMHRLFVSTNENKRFVQISTVDGVFFVG